MGRTKKTENAASILKRCTDKQIRDLDCPLLFLNRELSWVDFNARVLDEAFKSRNPLLDQLKFLAIFYNNLDEFFMVRVSRILHRYHRGLGPVAPDGMGPARQLAEIRRQTVRMCKSAQDFWRKTLVRRLAQNGVRVVRYRDLSSRQKRFLDGYFREEIYPVLTPQAIDPSHPFPTISGLSVNFLVELRDADGLTRFARLKCPGNVPRFVFVPRTKEDRTYAELGFSGHVRDDDILLLEDLIREYLGELFQGHQVMASGLFRLTRDADQDIAEDDADDLMEAVRDLMEMRRLGHGVRLEISHSITAEMRAFLLKHLEIQPFQVYRVRGPLGFSDFMALYGIDRPGLKKPVFRPRCQPCLQNGDMFATVARRDVFLYHPYDSFTSVLDFIRLASEDPDVIAIKQTLYRVGKDSPIVQALIEARRRNKQVTAVVELKARFDEERNITWAEELEKAGVNVVYGLPGMKIHAKLCLVVRREAAGMRRYVHIGTGNYNPSTAKMYTDMGLLTANADICADVTDLFNVMTGYARRDTYRALLVSPVSMRSALLAGIEQETALHKRDGNGRIVFKCNQLVDSSLICALYRASQAGVSIDLLIRGICCLRPGLPGISEHIRVTSVVGRFLEHARVFRFRNGGEETIYIGSADLMPRNLDRRIEVLTPVLDPNLRHLVRDLLDIQIRDNVQAWRLSEQGSYQRVKQGKEKAVSSQESIPEILATFSHGLAEQADTDKHPA